MTFINKKQVAYYDSASLDAFSRVRTSGANGNRFDAEFTFDNLEEIVDEVLGGVGGATHLGDERGILLNVGGTTTNDFSGLHSYPVPYTAGQSQLIELTGVLDYKAIGGGIAQTFLRTKVSGSVVETAYSQANWAVNGINTSPLQSDVDWTKSQIFVMDFQSLRVGRIRFYLDRGGELVQVHEIINDNIRKTGYWQTPSLPAYWRIYNDATYTYMEIGYGDTSNAIGFRYRIAKNATAEMTAICGTVKSEGGKDLLEMQGYPQAASRAQTTKTISTTLVPLISIRARSTFKTFDNNAIAIPNSLSISTDNAIRIVVLHDCTLTNASWADVDTDHSTLEYDIAATAYTGGHVIFEEYVSTAKIIESSIDSLLGKAVLWHRQGNLSGILTVAAIRTGTNNAAVLGAIRWVEIR